jgi:iron complex transport system substrate-binding protein
MRARRMLVVVPLLVGCLLASACSADETSSAAEPEPTAVSGGTFPVTVSHKFGETTVTGEPTRVVSVGVTEHDILLELGVVPVAVTEWYGEKPFATWPWAEDLLGDAEPEVLDTSDGLELERIAALRPDLIVGTNAGLTQRDYDLLSQIAPTIASVEGSTRYFSSWQDQTLQIARGLGREADGEALVDRVEGRYADAAAAHPEWAGLTATFSQGGPYDGQLYVYPAGLSTDFLSDLGFTMTTGLEDYAPDVGVQAEISAENVGLIDADVVVFATESQDMFDELQGFGTIANLPAVAENRAVYTGETLAGAIYFDTPLSLEYALDRLTPMLELATRGESPRRFTD